MIILCESCSRKFVVKDSDIPKEGRMVECGFWSQKWFQTSIKIQSSVESNIDKSHPINYGIESNKLPLFRNSNIYMGKSKQSFNNPISYSSNPLMSGYISEENLSLLKNSVPFKVIRSGKGKIILITDNTNFRAFWYGTNRILLNSIFHSNIM